MKKLFFVFALVCLVAVLFAPVVIRAVDPIVQCTGKDCDFDELKAMLERIINVIVTQIATPLAIIAIIIAAVLMMTSAGDPGRMGLGKKVLYAAIIGLFLAFGTRAIIQFILDAIGYKA